MNTSEKKAHLNNKKPGKRKNPGKNLPLKMSCSQTEKKTGGFLIRILKGQKIISSINNDQSVLRKDKD